MQKNTKNIIAYYFPIATAFFLGSFLRLYGIEKQVPLDDEWHGLFAAAVNSYSYLASHLFYSGISIPYTLYQKFVLSTVGWNEITIRAPSITAGILSLLICPWYVNRIFGKNIALIFSFLLAFSPLLIFYSRYARSYSVVMLLLFVAFFSFHRWVTTGNHKERNVFIMTSVLSVYFHLFAMIPILGMFLYTSFLSRKNSAIHVSGKNLILVGCACLAFTISLYLPALMNSTQSFLFKRVNIDHPDLQSFFGVVSLLLGTSNKSAMTGIIAFLFLGQTVLFKQDKLMAGLFIAILASITAAIITASPPSMQVSLQIARYGIVLFAFSYILMAIGIDSSLRFLKQKYFSKGHEHLWLIDNMLPAAVILLIILTGPLLHIYRAVNNFTNHGAYQESYDPLPSNQPYISQAAPSYHLIKENMPVFYKTLSNEKQDFTVLEYPMLIGDYFNFYYYYQRLHQKDVMVGYHPGLTLSVPPATDIIAYGNFPIDFIINNIRDKSKLGFKTIVNMLDINTIKSTNIRYIMIHKNLLQEGFNLESLKLKSIPNFIAVYRSVFGIPIYEDNWVTVFDVKKGTI